MSESPLKLWQKISQDPLQNAKKTKNACPLGRNNARHSTSQVTGPNTLWRIHLKIPALADVGSSTRLKAVLVTIYAFIRRSHIVHGLTSSPFIGLQTTPLIELSGFQILSDQRL